MQTVHQSSKEGILSPKLLVFLMAGCIVGVGILFYSIYSEVSNRIRQDRQDLMTHTAGFLLSHIDEWLDKNVRVLKAASKQSQIIAMDPSAQAEILKNIQQEYPWIYLVFTLDKDGNNISRSDGGMLKTYSDREYFKKLVQGASMSWQTLIGKTSNRPSLVLALPIVKDGIFSGVIAAAMTTETISQAVDGWHMGRSGIAFLMDEKNKVIAHPDNRFVMEEKDLGQHILLAADQRDALRVASYGEAGFLSYTDRSGVSKIGTIRENNFGWHLILEQNQKEAFRELYKFQKFMIIVFGVVVVMIIVIAWLFARISVFPVLKMINAGLLREKDLEHRLQKVRKMEALGTFAGGIAHDFNNILGAITTCSEMAIEDVDEKNPAHEDLKHILKAATRGKKLVKQILEYSRSRNTRQKPVKLHRIIIECLDLFKSFKPESIEVELNITSKQGVILADPTQIHQVVMNLLLNAEQAMAGKKGVLTISLSEKKVDPDKSEPAPVNPNGEDTGGSAGFQEISPGLYLHLAVSDTGCGIEPHVLERMFDPFYTTHMNTGGTGLGLAMSDVIVRRHKGLISAESKVEKGSTFHIFLPCIGDDDTMEQEDKQALETLTGNEEILFVDDDEQMIYSAPKMLRRLGYKVSTADNAAQALALFNKNPGRFDLVITDRVMPGRTGVGLAHDIKEIREDIPVIMCSGFFNKKDDTFLDAEYDLDGLIDETISKPFEIKPLSMIIRKVLDRSSHGN
ncbi:MAG: ATP-binding protein [Desulfobacterales bacterium]|nr:ATP-binding protein [Desulfobacterales bacterium]